ncbi:MAG: bacteriocin fulvocin C-related protein [Gemmatimonadaceae bacterium]|nr:bacteriocin fulvocin C-related protein [Gemmatimonadaceae bacterium]
MTRQSAWRAWLGVATFCGIALLGVGAIGYISKPPTPTKEVQDWLKLSSNVRPTTLSGIAAQPERRRRPLIAMLSAEEKVALWREHLSSFVLPSEQLSPAQRAIRLAFRDSLSEAQIAQIRFAIERLPDVFDERKPLAARQKVANELCTFNRTLFSRAQAGAIFATIGVSDVKLRPKAADSLVQPNLIRASIIGGSRAFALLNIGAAKLGLVQLRPCNCSASSYCSCGNCGIGGSPCAPETGEQASCGCFMTWPCDGRCPFT